MFITLALAVSSPAHALSCLWGVSGTNVQEGDVVPTNAVFRVDHTFDATAELELELVDAAGAEVPVSLEKHDGYAMLVPSAPLAPEASYRLRDVSSEGYTDVGFTTSAGPDGEAPEAPTLLSAHRYREISEWGRTRGIRVELEEPAEAVTFEYQLSVDGSFTDPLVFLSGQPQAYLGHGLCSDSLPDYEHRERYHLRVRALDIAGNASDWTSEARPVGCTSVGGAPLLAGLPLALLAVCTRRRSRG